MIDFLEVQSENFFGAGGAALAVLVAHIEPIHVSDHACFARAEINQKYIHAADLLPTPFSNETLDVMCANIQRVQDRLKRSIAVENLSAYVTCNGSEMPETTFLIR